MPSADEHRRWAQQNEEVYAEIGGRGARRADWALTILFYAAVHEIKAFFVDHPTEARAIYGRLPKTHGEIKETLRKNVQWRSLAAFYEQFLSWSKKTRYHCHMPREQELQFAERQLREIRAEIARLNQP
jgi:hypothetical protein